MLLCSGATYKKAAIFKTPALRFGGAGLIEHNILYQDNKSTILLAKNGQMLARKKSKHIKNIYFIVMNKIAQGDLEICHKKTNKMWADVNTKLLQGMKYRVMRSEVMGVIVKYDNDVKRRRTHPLLIPKIETEQIPVKDGEDLERLAIMKCVARDAQKREATLHEARDRDKVLIPHRTNKPAMNQRSVLEVSKYDPGKGSYWKSKVFPYPALSNIWLPVHRQYLRRTGILVTWN